MIKFYLGFSRGRGLLDALVRWLGGGHFAHCEFILEHQGKRFLLGASRRDGGVRLRAVRKDELRHWRLLPLPEEPRLSLESEGYDYAGALRFLLPGLKDHPRRWFCSEYCAAMLNLAQPWRFSPGSLFLHMKEKLDE